MQNVVAALSISRIFPYLSDVLGLLAISKHQQTTSQKERQSAGIKKISY